MKSRVFTLLFLMAVALFWGTQTVPAQDDSYPMLPRSRFLSGAEVLTAFSPVSAGATNSIVEVNVDGDAVALGTVVDAEGLVLTKASEIKPGKLTCWLASGQEVPAVQLGADDDEDIALLRVGAEGLKPVRWSTGKAVLGQWAITPALADTPQAVGIISALPRRIQPERAFIGVRWSPDLSEPKVAGVMPGLGAEKAGIKPGDVIVAVNNELVTTVTRVSEILQTMREGQTVRLKLERDGERFEVNIKLMVLGWEEYALRRSTRMAGDTSRRAEGFDQVIEHDTVIPPWLCGGPLMNLDGEALGINIARASRVATYALPADLVKKILASLKPASTSP
ncbi:MAG: S1C family serine protease [Limisphaerales bacterium]